MEAKINELVGVEREPNIARVGVSAEVHILDKYGARLPLDPIELKGAIMKAIDLLADSGRITKDMHVNVEFKEQYMRT